MRRTIGVTAQDATLDDLLTGRQNLVMVGELCGLHRGDAKRRASDLLARFELTDAADRVLKGYSGGMRRRLDLAAGLVMRPPVLFLDEPTTGLDPTEPRADVGVIRDLVATARPCSSRRSTSRRPTNSPTGSPSSTTARSSPTAPRHELKAATGGARLEVTLSAAHSAALAALTPLVDGRVDVSQDGKRLKAAVRSGSGLATAVVRALDSAGVLVDDVQVRPPSLDDVFFALTGRPADDAAETHEPARELQEVSA